MSKLSKALQAAAGNAAEPVYVEDVFSTYLYTGNGSTQTITNGIDLAGQGGLVWVKSRSNVSRPELVDSARGTNSALYTNGSDAAGSNPSVYNLLSTGFQVGVGSGWGNESGYTYASWTFRKQPKFFDVVTYTGNGTGVRTLSHNLGSVPGCIMVKRYNGDPQSWAVYHRSLGNTQALALDLTNAADTWSGYWNNTSPTATQFTVGGGYNSNNPAGTAYVAYLFAHDAGGFGLTGTDNVISCGSFTTDGSGAATVSLGYEPQWIMIKSTGSSGWSMWDTMRGLPVGGADAYLFANSSAAEATFNNVDINATGFNAVGWGSSSTYIYIAIRRGPMKTPTSGTSVFSPNAYNGTGTSTIQTLTTNFPVDAYIQTSRQDSTTNRRFGNRLTGKEKYSLTNLTAAEQTIGGGNGVNNNVGYASNTGIGVQGDWNNPSSPAYSPYIMWNFRRAPGFFDVVCYTGNGTSSQSITHNLGATPELFFVKRRSSSGAWEGYSVTLGSNASIRLNESTAAYTGDSLYWNNTAPTSTTFNVGTYATVNASSATYVAYLFATVAGVSKVGSYTGTGTTQQINCGFSSGARFVLIKRTDSTGDWYVWDSARGIVAGNDPYLLLNSTAAEVTSTDYIDTYSAGFEISSTAPAAINANGGSFIFLAIA